MVANDHERNPTRQRRKAASPLAWAGNGAAAPLRRNGLSPWTDRRQPRPAAKSPTTDTATVSGTDDAVLARDMAAVGRRRAHMQIARRSRQISDANRQWFECFVPNT